MEIGDANVLVTTKSLYKRKIAAWRDEIPSLQLVLIVGDDAPEGCVALGPALEDASPDFQAVRTQPEDPALIHFTSGTTGKPKGAVHVHEAVLYHAMSGRYALELQPGVTYWCTADPGWVTGTTYGIISPLVNRVTMIIDEAEFNLERWYGILEQEQCGHLVFGPDRHPDDDARGQRSHQGFRLQRASVFGQRRRTAQPRGRDLVARGVRPALPRQLVADGNRRHHDRQTRCAQDIKPGSMGKPMPGIHAGIVEKDNGGLRELGDGEIGELALRPGWPSMMRTYLHEQARYDKCFQDGWYLSGDLAMRDADGYFWFVGRADDLIKSSGHLIGPFEVESALIEHDSVAEAAAIGIPDETAGEVVKAYVTLNPGQTPSEDLERDIRGLARKRLGAAVAPREIVFRVSLPKTRSGKIMRRLLKARELGLPEGDISTLEVDEK